ncbi:MAG: hypothetical protein ACR5LD_02500 [Symbiopectobacterium sp.]
MVAHHALLLLTLPVSIVLRYPVCRTRYHSPSTVGRTFLLKIPLLGTLMRGEVLSYLFTLLTLTQRARLTLPFRPDSRFHPPLFCLSGSAKPDSADIEQGDSLQQRR